MFNRLAPLACGLMLLCCGTLCSGSTPPIKERSMFSPPDAVEELRATIEKTEIGRQLREQLIEASQFWIEKSDRELWEMMFSANIPRSWMVWSSGHCPACGENVPMNTWQINAMEEPWKVACPHCGQRFPTNDFEAYHQSGLNEHGLFEPHLADRSLLFNTDHPDPDDPMHLFGVDDGHGYVEGIGRWRFVATYLVYGQWQQLVHAGIRTLAQTYLVTGEPIYAHKAAVLLDRVADVYGTFDFKTQGIAYESPSLHGGYVSVWHGACGETQAMALAYDMIFDEIENNHDQLVSFLSEQAQIYKLDNSKSTFAMVQQNIEDGILRDAIDDYYRAKNPFDRRIHANYPRTDIAVIVMKAILDWPENRDDVYEMIDQMIVKTTAIDGVTWEKGLSGYSTIAPNSLAMFISEWSRGDPGFLKRCFEIHPQLYQTFRFHIDTWCLENYYPITGDAGHFARPINYRGLRLNRLGTRQSQFRSFRRFVGAALSPSMFTFLWDLYELTGDVAFVQVMYHANEKSVEGMPYDMFVNDAEAFQEKVAKIIAEHGSTIQLGSVNKEQWHIAILRAGQGDHARAAWMVYDAGEQHGNQDAMHLGLFAYGLDMMSNLGYPPVQYGGWEAPEVLWYRKTAAHNTVTVDGLCQPDGAGKTTLWADGERFRTIRASAPNMINLISKIPHKRQISDPWKFMWDPNKKGEDDTWYNEGFDDNDWMDIETDTAWQNQKPGKEWKQQHGEDYNGVAWYRQQFNIEKNDQKPQVHLLFGAIDIACTIWVNGQMVMDRSEIHLADKDAWREPFLVNVTNAIEYDRPNTVAVRVDNVRDFGGIWRGVWLVHSEEPEIPLFPPQYERTIVTVDMPDPDRFYMLDVFRVAGGSDQAKFMHSQVATLETKGLFLTPGEDYGHHTHMRNFKWDSSPKPGWQVDWKIDDQRGIVSPDRRIYLRYTGLTNEAKVGTCEGWVSTGGSTEEEWFPRLVVRQQSDDELLSSTFVGVIEPYEDASAIQAIRRLPVTTEDGQPYPDNTVAVEITYPDGTQDLILAADVENPLEQTPSLKSADVLVQKDWEVALAGELCLVRRTKDGKVVYIAAANTESIRVKDFELTNDQPAKLLEWKE